MSTVTRLTSDLGATRDGLSFGPWRFQDTAQYTQFFGTSIELSALTQVQLVGGVSPHIGGLTTVQLLLLYPEQDIQVGLHGVNAQAAGFTLSAWKQLVLSGGSINAVSIYNMASVTAKIFVALGGI